MAILSKGWKPDNFESHNSLKLNFMNFWGLHSNFVDCESFLESNSANILALCETNFNDSIAIHSFIIFFAKYNGKEVEVKLFSHPVRVKLYFPKQIFYLTQ